MREILFRAKTIPNCKDVITGKIIKTPKWIYGYVDLGYMHDCETPLISDEKGNKTYKCQYETIGQYTGLTDKNGKKIFEGDIVKISGDLQGVYACVWEECNFEYEFNTKGMSFSFACVHSDDIEVIGNIHDNPELLKEGADNG